MFGKLFFLFVVALFSVVHIVDAYGKSFIGQPMKVDFDGRSFKINDERQLFIAGSFHYPRAPRSEWPAIFQLAKDQGINLIQTYVFWDIHEPENDQWNFPSDPNSSEDLVAFIQEAAKFDLYVHLRIAGYVCAEWNFGGLPVWLKNLGVTLRTYNDVWLTELSQFMEKTLSVVSEAGLLARDGGPIVMLQIENEYGNMESNYGDLGRQYVAWLSDYAQSLPVGGIPWVMCQQGEGVGTAPASSIVNACNGFYCDDWIAKHRDAFPNQPHMWTENWPGWFQNWGEPVPHRPSVDIAYAVASWFAKGGTYMNYYMLFGGTNFGRSVGGPLIVTSYDYDVAINEYAQKNEPKYSHLASLHAVLQTYAHVLLQEEPVYVTGGVLSSSGSSSSASAAVDNNKCQMYQYGNGSSSGEEVVVFFINAGESMADTCVFDYEMSAVDVPAWSVSIGVMKMKNNKQESSSSSSSFEIVYNSKTSLASLPHSHKAYDRVADFTLQLGDNGAVNGLRETLPSYDASAWAAHNRLYVTPHPEEQIALTQDQTDYLWYSALVDGGFLSTATATAATGIKVSEEEMTVTIQVQAGTATGTFFYVYWEGQLVASSFGDAGKNPVVVLPAGQDGAEADFYKTSTGKSTTSSFASSSPSYYTPANLSWSFSWPTTTTTTSDGSLFHLDILSVSMGLKNYGPFLETIQSGIVSPSIDIAFASKTRKTLLHSTQPKEILHAVGLQLEQPRLLQFKPTPPTFHKFVADGTSPLPLSSAVSAASKPFRGLPCDPRSSETNGMCWFTTTFVTPSSLLTETTTTTTITEDASSSTDINTSTDINASTDLFSTDKKESTTVTTTEMRPDVFLALNLGQAMGKGSVFVNGHALGRYWNVTAVATEAQTQCFSQSNRAVGCNRQTYFAYTGAYSGDKCRTGCQTASQMYYKLPASFLNPTAQGENVLEIFEEIGGRLDQLQLYVVRMDQDE